MAQYKKGIATNESIIQNAKEAFKAEGLKATTIAAICKRCNIKLGTFTYYYNKKEDLLAYIYTDYMQRCRDFITNQHLKLSSAEKHIYVVALYYYNLYHNPAIFNFHKEVLSVTSMNNIFASPKEMIEDFAIEGNIPDNYLQYNYLIVADNAVRREFNLIFINKHSSIEDVRVLLESIYYVAAKIFNLDTERILKIVNEAYLFAKEKGDNNITLL